MIFTTTRVDLSVTSQHPTMFNVIITFIVIIVIIATTTIIAIMVIMVIVRVADTEAELSVSGRRPTMFWSKYWGSGVPGPRHHYSRDR